MHILPLGTNGFFPSYKRSTACYALQHGETLILFDAGSGLFHFAESVGKNMLKSATNIHIYLSHYHLDHTFGFYAAFKLFTDKNVVVFGKAQKKVFSELPKLNYFPIQFKDKYKSWQWKQLEKGSYKMKDYHVTVRKQSHRGHGSLAFRLDIAGQSIAYVTDSEPVDDSVRFVKDVNLLLHEHGESGEDLKIQEVSREKHIIDGHVTSVGAAMIAKEAGVKKLVLIHHNPFATTESLILENLIVAQSVFPNCILAKDLKPIAIPSPQNKQS